MNVGWKSSHLGEPARLTGPTHLQPEILSKASVDVLCIDETKLDANFPDHQFKISGWWEIVFVREGFMVKQITLIPKMMKLYFSNSRKKWCILFAFRPPDTNKTMFFKVDITLGKTLDKYSMTTFSKRGLKYWWA